MCGIVGIWDANAPSVNQLHEDVRRLTDTLTHRGPDDCGHWLDPEFSIALGHRRLSILDLSPAGRQPMPSFCGRFQLVFNGELYNYRDLRTSLEAVGIAFRGHSDTEVLAAGLSHWGLDETLRRSIGMWAFAVWDQQRKTLSLARDRLGIKPLYYHWSHGRLLFGSELKALRAHPKFTAEIDRGAVAQFMRYGYIPAPQSIYQSTWKLPPGACLEIADVRSATAAPRSYWSLNDIVCQPRQAMTDAEAGEQFEEKLSDAVSLRMISDVPLGAFLSGGIDSSLIVAAMQQQSAAPVKTFCIGFAEEAYDESPYAEAIARHLGTEHRTLKVTSQEARDVIPELPSAYDEPFADSSQIPTILVSRLAREHVTVSLSGDGGDELFGGYTRYSQFADRWKKLQRLPSLGRRAAAAAMRMTAVMLPPAVGDKFRRRALGIDVHSPGELYAVHNAHWKDAHNVVLGDPDELRLRWEAPSCRLAPQELWMATDGANYLPDDILVKVDRASMSCGLEARVPLLDHRIVEWSWSLPWQMKVRGGVTKWLMREALAKHVPRKLFERPKMGFGVPIGQWLRGPLRDWADDLLQVDRLQQQGLLNARRISDLWERHRSGRQNWEYMLWDVLMLQSWLDQTPASLLSAGDV